MTRQEPEASPLVDADDEAADVVRQCEVLLDKCATSIDRLQAALREEIERHDQIEALRDEAKSLRGVHPRLRIMRQRAAEHGIRAGRPASSATLHVVPDAADESPPPAPPAPDDDSTPGTSPASRPASEAEARNEPQSEVLIRSQKQQEILTVIASRPTSEPPMGSEEIAKALGIPQEARKRKSLRNCLRALVTCGALERVTHGDDRHVYYRPLKNWKFV